MSDVRVKRGAELSTDHHLVVCTLKALKPLKKRKTFRPRETYRIKRKSLADKEVRTAFADNIASKFKELPTSTEDIETEWCLFRTAVITSATNCCGRKCVGGTKSSEKRTPWWNQEVKEAIRAKKVAYKAWLANKSSLELRSQYSEARKSAFTDARHATFFYRSLFILFYCWAITRKPSSFTYIIIFVVLSHVAHR